MSDRSPETQTITVERDLPFTPDRVWQALTRPHLMAEWLMQNDFLAVVGHRFSMRADWGGTVDCQVLAIEPNHSLSYSWTHVIDSPDRDLESVVTFTLTPSAGGTHLRMEQTGFRPGQKMAFHGARNGWPRFLDRLEAVLAGAS